MKTEREIYMMIKDLRNYGNKYRESQIYILKWVLDLNNIHLKDKNKLNLNKNFIKNND